MKRGIRIGVLAGAAMLISSCGLPFDPEERAQEACSTLEGETSALAQVDIQNDEERVQALTKMGEALGQIKVFDPHQLSQQAQGAYSAYVAWKATVDADNPLGTAEARERYGGSVLSMELTCRDYGYMKSEQGGQEGEE